MRKLGANSTTLQARTAVLLVAVTLGACTPEPAPEPETPVRPVRYLDVTLENSSETRVFSGVAEPSEQADISFKVSGTLRQRPVSVGDRTVAGSLLGKLDDQDLRIAVKEAQAQVSKASAELRNAEANYDRVRELYENDNVSQSELSSARATAESAKAQLGVARQSLTNAKLQLSYAVITAPGECEVEQTFFKVNENVGSGQPVVRLNCGVCVDVRVSVPETYIGSIHLGEAAVVSIAALPGQVFKASVDEVGVSMSKESRAFPVVVKVDEGCDLIRSGMAADVKFTPHSQATVEELRVPWVAVGEDRNGRHVFVLDMLDDTLAIAKRRSVEIGETNEHGIVIANGLSAGERIVTAGVRRVTDGMKVKLFDNAP